MSFTLTYSKYKYFKNKTGTRYYKYDEWEQPILTSNTSYGTVTATANQGETSSSAHPIYMALDGDATTWWEAGASTYSGYLQWVLPERIIVKGMSISVRTGDRPNITVRCYTSSDKTTAIGDSITTTVAGETKVVSGIPANGVTTDTLYFDCSSTEDYFGISEIVVDATLTTYYEVTSADSYDFTETYTYGEEVSPSDEYDYIEIIPQSYSVIKEVEKYFKNVTRYYKYAEQTWVQPKLTSNGLVGISEFATEASSERDIRLAYRAFDGSNLDSEVDCWHTMSGQSGWLVWYVKNPIKISSLTIYNRPMYNNTASTVNSIKEWELQVSDDGITWRTIKNGTNSNNEAQSGWDITIESSVQVYSNYWRLNIHSSNGTDLCVGEIKINAIANIPYEVSANDDYDYVETLAEETTSDDYDFTETTEKFYKVEWVNPILCSITVMTDAPIRNDFITINGSVLKTDSNGKVVLRCNYGSPEAFYIRYGNWANVVVIDPRKNNVIITLKQ